jgi:hypothetical protein
MDSFFELDKNQVIPLKLTVHLLLCKKCRKSVRLMTIADHVAKKTLEVHTPVTDASLLAIMQKIDPSFTQLKSDTIPHMSLVKWIIAGVILISTILSYGIFGLSSLRLFQAPLYIFFAVIIAVYCALFIGCNLDFFIKKIETIHHRYTTV